jgi:hypothetical protein
VFRFGPRHRASGVARLTLLFLIAAALAAPQAFAVRYVNVLGGNNGFGSGTNDCVRRSAPCASVQHAVAMAPAGDEIVVSPGDYLINPSLILSAPYSIHGVAGQAAPALYRNADATAPVVLLGAGSAGSVLEHLDVRYIGGSAASAVRVETASTLAHVDITVAGSGGAAATPVPALHVAEPAGGAGAVFRDASVTATSNNGTPADGTVRVSSGELSVQRVTIERRETDAALAAALSSAALTPLDPRPTLDAEDVTIEAVGGYCAYLDGAADTLVRATLAQAGPPGAAQATADCVHVRGPDATLADLAVTAADQTQVNSSAVQINGIGATLLRTVADGSVNGLLLGGNPGVAGDVEVRGGRYSGGTNGVLAWAADGLLADIVGSGRRGVGYDAKVDSAGIVALQNVTAMSTGAGSGVELAAGAQDVAIHMEDSIAAGAGAPDIACSGADADVTAARSIFDLDVACVVGEPDAPNLTGVDPLLTADGRLAAGSPAIDAGGAAAPLLGTRDFEGDLRSIDGEASSPGAAPDIGGDEYTLAPLLTSLSASGIAFDAATLGGVVDPRGSPTTWRFEYGPGFALASAPVTIAPDAGPTPVSAAVAGLAPGTPYEYRLVAVNSADSAELLGAFATPALPVPDPLPGGGPVGPGGSEPPAAPARLRVRFAARKTQRLRRQRNRVRAAVRTSEAATWNISGRVKIRGAKKAYRVKTRARRAGANRSVKVKIKLGRRALRAVRLAFARHGRVTLTLTANARTSDGRRARATRRVRLK